MLCCIHPHSHRSNLVELNCPSFVYHQKLHHCWVLLLCSCTGNCLDGLVVEASGLRAEDSWFESHLQRDFSRLNHTIDSKIGTPVAILPGAWHYRVSTGTGWHCVSIL